ncbi:MAG TPA: hypothetical protein PKI16_01600 [Candidatus Dojkabacteria bacterium]|nr:hypothetical protein [Candidatus Dojkabacteria bacterium]
MGLIIFWRGSVESRKERSSTFDLFFLSGFFSLVSARIAHIVANWEAFSGFIWYWLPYERYGEEIFLFRLLPWRFLNIFDGGINILVMFVSFLLFATIGVVIIKKWKWRDMFPVVFFSAESMLAMSFLFSGVIANNMGWIVQGGVLLIPIILILIILSFVTPNTEGKEEKSLYIIVNIFLILLSTGFILYVYLKNDIELIDKISCLIFLIWSLIGSLSFLREERGSRFSIERVSSVRTISSADINQPIRLSK